MRARLAAIAHLTALVALLGLGAWSVARARLTPAAARDGGGADLELYQAIVQRLRQGENYYAAAAAELRAPRGPEGGRYPTRSLFNWRLPTLACLMAGLPDAAARALLGFISLAGVYCLFAAMRRDEGIGAAAAGAIVLFSGVLWGWTGLVPEALWVHETWAGALIALAVGARGRGWPAVGLSAGLGALFIRELALPFVVLCGYLAWSEGKRKEAAAWTLGIIAFGGLMIYHAGQVAGQMRETDLAQTASWLQFGGWTFVLKTAHLHPLLLELLPTAPWLAAALLPLALFGLGGWSSAVGRHAGLTVLTYVLAYSIAGQPFNYLWGLLYTPLWPLGLVFLPRTMRSDCRALAGGRQ